MAWQGDDCTCGEAGNTACFLLREMTVYDSQVENLPHFQINCQTYYSVVVFGINVEDVYFKLCRIYPAFI